MKIIIKFLRIFSIALSFSFCLSTIAKSGNIHDIKGTWDILKPEYREALSPVCGAIGIEFKYIEKLYHLGSPDDATIQLIKKLFHSVPGGFMPSSQNIPSKFFSIGTVGTLLNSIEYYKNTSNEKLCELIYTELINDRDFGYQRYLELKSISPNTGDLKNKSYQIIRQNLNLDYKNLKKLSLIEIIQKLNECLIKPIEVMDIDSKPPCEEEFDSGQKHKRTEIEDDPRDTKKRKKDFCDKEVIKDLISKLNMNIEIEELAKKFEGHECKNIKQDIYEFIEILVKSLRECDQQEPIASSSSSQSMPQPKTKISDSIFRPYTTQHALLCWVYKQMDKKSDLVPFFEKLDERFFIDKGAILNKEWAINKYSYDEHKSICFDSELSLVSKSGQEIFNIYSGNKFADLIFAEIKKQFYSKKIPMLPEWKNIFYEEHKFADCMETTIRNLCNIITYDQETATFGNEPKSIVLSQDLIKFYQSPANRTESETDTALVRESWSSLVQNLSNISYCRIKPTNGRWYITCPNNCHGFIRLNGIQIPQNILVGKITLSAKNGNEKLSFDKILINDSSYLIAPECDNYHLYEMQASANNLIIIMNDLFNLNLFKDKNDLSNNFFKRTFNSIYFEKLCHKLGWLANINEIKQLDINNNDIQQKLNINTNEVDKSFTLNIYPFTHAFTSRHQYAPPISGYKIKLQKYLNDTLEIDYNSTKAMLYDIFPSALKTTNFAYRYIPHNLFDKNIKSFIAHLIIKTNNSSPAIISLISQIIKSFNSSENIQIYKSIAESLSKNSNFFKANLQNEQFMEAFNCIVKQATECQDEEVRLKTLLLLCPILIICNKQDIAIEMAQQFSSHNQQKIKTEALKIFLKLVEKKFAFDEAKKAAIENIKSHDWRISIESLKIIKALFKNNAILNSEAELYATEGVSNYQWQVTSNSLDIFIEFIKKGISFESAIKIGTQTISSPNKNISKKTITLFKELFKRKHGFAQALEIIIKNGSHQDKNVKTTAVNLFLILIQYPEGISLALEYVKNNPNDLFPLLSFAIKIDCELPKISSFIRQISINEKTEDFVKNIKSKLEDNNFFMQT